MSEQTANKGLLNILPETPPDKKGWPWTEETDPKIYGDSISLPKISIITPSFNQGKFIEQTIRSVLLQNYPNLEYIIIDGGSTDNTAEIIKKYEPWLKYWVSEKDNGQTNAINKGLLKCEGEIFNWLNSDDFYYKDCFKLIVDGFSNTDTNIVAGQYRFFFENEPKEKMVNLKLRDTLEETLALVAINQPSTFFRLKIFKGLGGLDERLHFVMDQDIWKKYLFTYGQDNIVILNNYLTNFRFHSNSKTFQFNFINEFVSIFHSIAMKAGMTKHAEALKKVYGNDIEKDYDFNFKFSEEKVILAKKAINNLFFFNARESYSAGNFNLLNLYLSVLEKKWLTKEQKGFVFGLQVKSKLIKYNMGPVLKMINSRNSKAKLKINDQ